MNCGVKIMKWLLFFFNAIFWLMGVGILIIGIVGIAGTTWLDDFLAKVKIDEVEGVDIKSMIRTLALVLIIVGSIMTVVGFLGCCGAVMENQCMLGLYFLFILIVTCSLIASAVFVFVKKGDIYNLLEKYLKQDIEKGRTDNKWNAEWKNTVLATWEQFSQNVTSASGYQADLACCAVTSCKADYTFSGTLQISPSCNKKYCEKGCVPRLKALVDSYGLWIGVGGLVFAAVLLFGLLFSMCLCCAIRNDEKMA